jgi:electron transfer flavoprotein alpha/beta subunit
VLTLGPAEATEQLRSALAVGVERAILLQTDGEEWDPRATARAIVGAVRKQEEAGQPFDLLLFGNESADSGGYQVGVRVATPSTCRVVTGVEGLEIVTARGPRPARRPGGWEVYEVPLPAVFTVKEGINLPRYPSVPGRLRAKKKPIAESTPAERRRRPAKRCASCCRRKNRPTSRYWAGGRRRAARRRPAARAGAGMTMILTSLNRNGGKAQQQCARGAHLARTLARPAASRWRRSSPVPAPLLLRRRSRPTVWTRSTTVTHDGLNTYAPEAFGARRGSAHG